MEKNEENVVENEIETTITTEDVYEEVVNVESKFTGVLKGILSGMLDQIIAVGLALILFFISDLILGVLGYKIAMRDEMFLVVYIISNVLYYPISEIILNGKTVGKKIVKR